MKKLGLILGLVLLTSCTDNSRSRNYGGTQTIIHDYPNEELLNITWKENNLWIVSKDTVNNILYGREKSSLGILEGEIAIKLK